MIRDEKKFQAAISAKPCMIDKWLNTNRKPCVGSQIAPLDLTLSDPETSIYRSFRV